MKKSYMITKTSRTSPQNSSDTGTNETKNIGPEIPRKTCISRKKTEIYG